MTRWWWVRHGPTHQKTFTGWRDVPADLSDVAQLERLSAFLPQSAVVVASDLIRAADTANAIAGARARIPNTDKIREFHFGEWDGRHFSDVAETHPELSREYWETPGDATPPGGESWNMAASRVNQFVADVTATHSGQDIVAVAHFGVILTQLEKAIEGGAYQALSHKIDNLSVTCLEFDGVWRTNLINHCP
jgi:alpha-ribazole phosphatase